MKRTVLVALIGLTIACSTFAQGVSLSFSGPTTWAPGTSVTLATQDTYNFGGSWGLSYWILVNPALAPFLTITDVNYFTFTIPNYNGPFPITFDPVGGFENADLGATTSTVIPDGSYHDTDITFALAAGAPAGTYTLRTSTASPRGSIQVDGNFGEHPIPEASFVFTVVPEPSTLALICLTGLGVGVMACRRRK
jgi:hypothetical protein